MKLKDSIQNNKMKVLIILLTAVIVISGCVQQQDTVKIGFIGPLSGEISNWGLSLQGGVRLAVSEINEKGRNLEVIYEDDKCDKTLSVNALRKLIEIDKVSIVIGPLCSGTVLADAPIAEENKVILLGFGSAASISDAGDYVFRPSYSDSSQGEFLAKNIISKFKNVGIIYVNNDYGIGLFSGFKRVFIDKGGKIVAEEKYNFEDKDWRTQLAKIKSEAPDALIIISYGREGGLIAKQSREIGIKVQIIGTDNFGTKDVIEAGGNAVENAIFTFSAPLDETNIKINEFKSNYTKINNNQPDILFVATNAYDTVKIVNEAINTVGNNATKIKSFLYDMPAYNGISGIIDFDEKGDATKDFVFQSIKNGTFTRVE